MWSNERGPLLVLIAVIIGDFCSLHLEIVFLVFVKKNVATVIVHELQCNVRGIRFTTIPGTQRRLSFTHGDYATVDGGRSQPSAEKVPVRVAGR